MTTGEVLREALVVFGRHWWRYLGLVAVVYVPSMVADLLVPWPWSVLVFPVDLVANTVTLGAVAYTVLYVSELRGVGVGAYLRIVPRLPRLVAVSFVQAIAVAIGFVLLIVPGLLLIARWSVYVPAIVAEQDSGLGLGRSSDLTSGRRWIGFWVVLLPVLVNLLVTGPNVVLRSDAIAWAGVPISLVVVTYGAVAAAVLYRRLVSFEVA